MVLLMILLSIRNKKKLKLVLEPFFSSNTSFFLFLMQRPLEKKDLSKNT